MLLFFFSSSFFSCSASNYIDSNELNSPPLVSSFRWTGQLCELLYFLFALLCLQKQQTVTSDGGEREWAAGAPETSSFWPAKQNNWMRAASRQAGGQKSAPIPSSAARGICHDKNPRPSFDQSIGGDTHTHQLEGRWDMFKRTEPRPPDLEAWRWTPRPTYGPGSGAARPTGLNSGRYRNQPCCFSAAEHLH